ncbi:MAG: slipin family protein, partial [Myxococcota bacterium]
MTRLRTIVQNRHVGLLYEDGVYQRTLEPGSYDLRPGIFDRRMRSIVVVDLRERSLVIKGQEILTRDKVAVRVSLLVYFRVLDAEAAIHNVENYELRIYEDVQLAARRFLASRELDVILSDRNEISDAVRETVRDAAQGYGVEIRRADVKDLVFPGNLRQIMNQVLETERRAEAKLIQARKDIEANRLQAEAQHVAARQELEAERERLHIELEARRQREAAAEERRRRELDAEVAEAEALEKHPALLKLRELRSLETMADRGCSGDPLTRPRTEACGREGPPRTGRRG